MMSSQEAGTRLLSSGGCGKMRVCERNEHAASEIKQYEKSC